MKNNNQKHNPQWKMLDCDLISEEFEEHHRISVPQFPKFKKPTYNSMQITSNVQYRINVCSPAKLDDTVSISTKKSTTNVQFLIQSSRVKLAAAIIQLTITFNKLKIILIKIQETEAQIIRNLISQKAKAIYMLDIKWAANYTAFLQNQHSTIPLEISNNNLFVDGDSRNPYRQNLKQDLDFVLMNRNTWQFLVAIYGGGPEITYNDYLGINNESQVNSREGSLQNIDISTYNSQTFQKQKFILPAIGLYNENNYCFLHAALQSLLSIEQLTCWVSIEGKSKRHEDYKWILSYYEIIDQIQNCKKGQHVKIDILKKLIKNQFAPNLQHDCQEFLCYLTEQLNKELKQNKYDQAITEILFQGQMMQQIQCHKCKQTSSKFESFFELSLSMNNMKGLKQCLSQFFAQEVLDDDYMCNQCNRTTKAIKKYMIGTAPQFLIIHLKRFQEKKLHNYIEFQNNLDITEFCSVKAQYKLKSVIVHYGTQEKGHYVNFSKIQVQLKWYYFDDHRVQFAREQDVLRQQAYILFFERSDEQLL
ncbi:unnamed protein product (macronuclear) [Paramecium tetraurelia]|uniref:Uncharacterized protein n=1 Tax=Paramecium tetraurelia TaxID=5888 RepID=A0C7X6_PARTE|nr:uncharacterized protein GSPATT00036024001 [Paramecium tetraurelia]CAK66893.1 unnamed protein product [Paramecium tetraurelia]|eukprot:XP_001434290.1 hypothetical protein (macronuclear) [Paramecium tetraurelia strain d4-2]